MNQNLIDILKASPKSSRGSPEHVPVSKKQPTNIVKKNNKGTKNVIRRSIFSREGVSTPKSAESTKRPPINIYGMIESTH